MSIGSGSLFSIIFLCRIMNIAYAMVIALIPSNVCLMFILKTLNIILMFSLKGYVWVP